MSLKRTFSLPNGPVRALILLKMQSLIANKQLQIQSSIYIISFLCEYMYLNVCMGPAAWILRQWKLF